MIALVGIVDSFNRTIDQSRAEIVGNAPGRLNVALSDFQPARSRAVRALAGAPGVARTAARLDLPGTLLAPGKAPVTVFMTINESPASGAAAPPVWTPTIQTGHLPTGAGEIAIAPKAATDLGVKVGGAVTLRVAGRGPGGATKVSNLKLRISGLTTDPFRVFAYADQPLATRIGMAGIANALSLMPAPGAQSGSVQRALASSPIVATTRPVTADSDALSETIDQFKGIIQVAAGAAFVLAVLMAFNIAGISLEERRREYATMFAFGLPVGRGLRIAATENLIVGVLGTALGLLIGRLTVNWIINSLFADTWPEIGMVRHLSAGSAAIAVLVGVVAVAATPYLLSRRLTRMDLPSTLRVVE